MPAEQSLPAWVYLAAVAIPALTTLVGVWYQGRKTRSKGTEEHVRSWETMKLHGQQLNEIQANVREVKSDMHEVKADVRELKATDRDHEDRLHAVEWPHVGEGA